MILGRRRRLARFAWVGFGGFLVQLSALQSLTWLGVPYLIATAAAVEAAILHNFLWHERWTWADRRARGRRRVARLLRFNGTTAIISVAGNVGLMALLAGHLRIPLLAANLLAVLTVSLLNFLTADRLVFSSRAGCQTAPGDVFATNLAAQRGDHTLL